MPILRAVPTVLSLTLLAMAQGNASFPNENGGVTCGNIRVNDERGVASAHRSRFEEESSEWREVAISAQDNPKRGTLRPCTLRDSEANTTEKPRNHRSKDAGNAAAVCLEVYSTSLSVQEHLQAFVREQKWRVGDADVGESLWTFSMALSKEELLGYAKTDATNERVQWRSGKARVSVRTTDLADGYSRVVVSARFDGFGEPSDEFAIKRESWALISNGQLEAKLSGSLRSRFDATR